MSNIATSPISFDFNSNTVRAINKNGEIWFVAADVCNILGLTNPSVSLNALDDDERSTINLNEYPKNFLGNKKGNPEVNIINESGLYALILRSRKPEAKAFRKWVTSVVLPAIRKNGYYSLTINKAQQGEIATLIAEKFPDGGSRPGAWSRFNNHFRIASYKDLPASKYDAAVEYIAQMKAPEKLPAKNIADGLLPAQSTLSELRVWSLQNLKREDADYVLKQCEKILAVTTRSWTAFNEILLHIQIAENYAKRFQHLI